MSSTSDLTAIDEVLALAGVMVSSTRESEALKKDQEDRREGRAAAHGVSVQGYEAFKGDRWWPGTRTTEFPGPQIAGGDRAWLAKRGYG